RVQNFDRLHRLREDGKVQKIAPIAVEGRSGPSDQYGAQAVGRVAPFVKVAVAGGRGIHISVSRNRTIGHVWLPCVKGQWTEGGFVAEVDEVTGIRQPDPRSAWPVCQRPANRRRST